MHENTFGSDVIRPNDRKKKIFCHNKMKRKKKTIILDCVGEFPLTRNTQFREETSTYDVLLCNMHSFSRGSLFDFPIFFLAKIKREVVL